MNTAKPHLAAGRIRIHVDLGSARASRAESRAPRDDSSRPLPSALRPPRQRLKTLTFGNISIPYGHYKSKGIEYWMLFYRDGAKRIRESRVSFEKLKRRAEEIATSIRNGQIAMSQFTEDQRASYRRCIELASQVNAPIELLVSEAVEARLKLLNGKFEHKACPKVVAEFLAQKDKELSRKKWFRSLTKMLNRLAAYFTGLIDELRPPVLNAWLRSLPGGLVYRKHHRAAAWQLLRFASGCNYLSREWPLVEQELKLVDNPELPAVKIKTWSPEQILKLLAHTRTNMIPFTVCQIFAGIRHEEIQPEEFDLAKKPLDWSNFDWDQKLIHVPEETAKTGEDRIIPMPENLIAWLRPLAQETGSICPLRHTANALCRAKQRAGLPSGRNQSRNVLRKTWISSRLALGDSIGQVAEWAGNSVAKIKSNYRRPMPASQARRLFQIYPTSADILQLPLGLAT